MNADSASIREHPSPHRHRVPLAAVLFGLFMGPIAWFTQLCIGYGLASTPCFHGDIRGHQALPGYEWTGSAMIAVSAVGLILALTSLAVAWRALARTREELEGSHHELMENGTGRTRFLALWGVCFSAGAAVTILATGVAFATLPRCAG